jgi:hypothetical protein
MSKAILGYRFRALVVASAICGFFFGGCGEQPPPAMTKEAFEATKAKQEEMLRKEYGLDQQKTKK